MKDNTLKLLEEFFKKNSIAKGKPTTLIEIEDAESELNLKFDKDFILFQMLYGGSYVKDIAIYGLYNTELLGDNDITFLSLTKTYRQSENACKDLLIINEDFYGNFIALNIQGQVIEINFDYDEKNILANTFEEYILQAFY